MPQMQDLGPMSTFYESDSPEELRLAEGSAQRLEFEVASAAIAGLLPPAAQVLDSCAGTGIYAFFLAGLGHQVTAGDYVPRNVEKMDAAKERPALAGTCRLDARNLSCFSAETFDAVLCMGALYHLHSAGERRQAVAESLRVLRPGGLLFASYMNRYAVIQNNARGSLENLDEILQFCRDGEEGVFYASTPEEAETLMAECGAEKHSHLSMDGVANFLFTTAGLLDETGLRRFGEYHKATCRVPSLLGAGYHNLYIGRKPLRN